MKTAHLCGVGIVILITGLIKVGEMNTAVLLVFGLIVVLVVLVTFYFTKMKNDDIKRETDYRVFYFMGVAFTGLGVVLMVSSNMGFSGLLALGIVYIIIGLKNRDKWKN